MHLLPPAIKRDHLANAIAEAMLMGLGGVAQLVFGEDEAPAATSCSNGFHT